MSDKDINVWTGEILPEPSQRQQPQSMIQMRSERCVAMIVPKPRDLERIERDVLKEAQFAKHDFYYAWSVNDNKNKRKIWIEGGTIGLAQSMYRCWNNCELMTEVRTEGGQWVFSSTFFDYENGLTLNREHRVRIPQIDQKDSDYDRKMDMKFQAWYSKNQRNTIFAALPRWLKNKAIDAAKYASQNELKGNLKEKLMKPVRYMGGKGITESDICAYFGKTTVDEFGVEDVERLCNMANQLYNGEISADDILNSVKEAFENEKKEAKQEEKQPPAEAKKESPKEQKKSAKKDQSVDVNKKDDFDLYMMSFEVRGISETEVCAYFMCESDEELKAHHLDDLKIEVQRIESEEITPEEFKKEAAERYEELLKDKK